MALMQCSYQSTVLGTSVNVNVLLPDPASLSSWSTKRKLPTLFLLHGIADDHSCWIRRSSIERYVYGAPLAIVMPYVNRSFYTDMVHGPKYETFLTKELPEVMRLYYPISDQRQDNFVAGFSMGGYGAFKWALKHPETFAAAASLSGVMDITIGRLRWPNDFANIFGADEELLGSDHDLFKLADDALQSGMHLPKLYQSCGTEDYLYESNVLFRDFCLERSIELTYDERPGNHSWDFWDAGIERVVRWLANNVPFKNEKRA